MKLKDLKEMIRILEEKNYDDECEIYAWDRYKEESISIDDWEYDDNGFVVYLTI